jgi:hypothetical protein
MIILPVTTLQRLWDADRGAGGTGDFAWPCGARPRIRHHVQDDGYHWFEKFSVPVPEFSEPIRN